jgi:hypothetical protein
MRNSVLALVLVSACHSSTPSTPAHGAIGFDGPEPRGWLAESTGGSGPAATWQVRADSAAVSPPNVLSLVATNHSSQDRFNLFWSRDPRFEDGRIALAVRADEGEIDRGGGPVWRVQDANNYYICRINPLESNYRVYAVEKGVRRQLATALVDISAGWHRIEVEHVGDRITCWLDDKKLLEARDATITVPGGVGLWTKADARTSFDDLVVTAEHE